MRLPNILIAAGRPYPKHIKILTECQLIKQEHSGREIYYHLNTKKMKEVDKWLEPFRAQWEARFNQLDMY